MPSYEYECEKCGHRISFIMSIHKIGEFEKICQQPGDGASMKDIICGGELTQVYDTAPASHFKGSGWTPKFGAR